ncbi:MAG TPA: dihydrolipoyl dehydrogenase [Candidatus Eisenbacteria bacterium]|nr:dihydrolipoyl dehydrogenase [Candidatus Eisenbacteria bacterium]
MADASHDLVVIGAGPGGYVAAIRAAQLGLSVGCVELEEALGGTCLRIGCIPSKALLESSERYHETKDALAVHGVKVGQVELDLPTMLKRKDEVVRGRTQGVDFLFKKNKITRYKGVGTIDGPGRMRVKSGPQTTTLAAKDILIATGSKPASLPGVEWSGDKIGSSTEALAYTSVPKHLVVIGAGYIGLELGSVWLRLGAKVTVVEYLDRILPGMDSEIAREGQKLLERQGMEIRLQQKVVGAKVKGKDCVVECEGQEPIKADRVLVAVGRAPNTEGLGLASVGVQVDERGRVPVDAHYQAAEGVYAIGDVIGGAMLAHKAEEEGVACVEGIVTGYGHVNYDAIPGVVYTQPEIATVGRSEDELKTEGVAYRRGVFFFRANARAHALGQIDGRVKVLADAATDRILGVHIIGPRAGDMIAEAVAAMEFGATSEDVARTCHAHPTLAEALKEAALAVDGRAIHS